MNATKKPNLKNKKDTTKSKNSEINYKREFQSLEVRLKNNKLIAGEANWLSKYITTNDTQKSSRKRSGNNKIKHNYEKDMEPLYKQIKVEDTLQSTLKVEYQEEPTRHIDLYTYEPSGYNIQSMLLKYIQKSPARNVYDNNMSGTSTNNNHKLIKQEIESAASFNCTRLTDYIDNTDKENETTNKPYDENKYNHMIDHLDEEENNLKIEHSCTTIPDSKLFKLIKEEYIDLSQQKDLSEVFSEQSNNERYKDPFKGVFGVHKLKFESESTQVSKSPERNLNSDSKVEAFDTCNSELIITKRPGHYQFGDKPLKITKIQYDESIDDLAIHMEWRNSDKDIEIAPSAISRTEMMRYDPLLLIYYYEKHLEFTQSPDFNPNNLCRLSH